MKVCVEDVSVIGRMPAGAKHFISAINNFISPINKGVFRADLAAAILSRPAPAPYMPSPLAVARGWGILDKAVKAGNYVKSWINRGIFMAFSCKVNEIN
jgi:hypothetical protein